jgi:hypothetical protein
MPSPMLAVALADPAYLSALQDAGFTPSNTVAYGGKEYTHDHIAAMVDESYMRHRPEFTEISTAKWDAPLAMYRHPKRLDRRNSRKFKIAVRNDVASTFGISPWTIFFGAIVLIFSGPFGLVMAIIAVLFEYYLSKDLKLDAQMMSVVPA